MPPSSAETLVTIDVSTGREAPETALCLAGVATRLNRLAVLRTVFRCLAVVLLAASALAACAAWLSTLQFRGALVALALAASTLVALSIRTLRQRWAHDLEAARWVEHKIPLEQRLLTLVSAPPGGSAARLWPELIADNHAQLPRWRADRLGISALPANVLLLLLALVAAWLFLAPWYGENAAPPEIPGKAVAHPQGDDSVDGAGDKSSPAGPGAQAGLQGGTKGGDGAGPQIKVDGTAPTGALDQLQSDLAHNFERSLGGSAMLQGGSGKAGDGDQPQAQRGAVGESGLGKSKAEEGGRVPDETMARREQDDGTGQAVQHENGGEGGVAKARPGTGEHGRPSDPNAQAPTKGGPQAGGRAVPGGKDPADGPLALGDEKGEKSHSGGAGAGSGKATEALLAKNPLTLNGGRQTAHFSLTLGGATGNADSGGPKTMVAQPRSRIADVERGPQEADRAVRHEEIPAEYEAVVKRIFKREP